MNKSSLVAVRDGVTLDKNFILATWLRGLFYGGTIFSEIPKNIFMEAYHRILEAILSSPNNKVRVACLKDDPDVILGYVVTSSDGNVIHWVFCKSAWRNIGIAKQLVGPDAKVATHLTKVGLSLLKKRTGMIFNPFAVN